MSLFGLLGLIRGANGRTLEKSSSDDESSTLAWIVIVTLLCLAAAAGYRVAGIVQTFSKADDKKETKSTQTDLREISVNDLTVNAIKVRLACYGLSGEGTKPTLIERLLIREPWLNAV